MKAINMATKWLLIIGGLNWGLYGFLNMDLVAYLFGADAVLAKVVYGAVALAAVYKLFCFCCNNSQHCHSGKAGGQGGGCCTH